MNKNIITFSTDELADLDEDHVLNLNNSKARLDRKSLRNTSPEVVPDLIWFYDSEVSIVKGLKLKKIE